MNNKVLLLPSYFPTKKAMIVGSQVHEQTDQMANYFDFRVIYCMAGMGWKRFIAFNLLYLITGKKRYISCTYDLAPGKLKAFGVYFFNSPLFTQQLNLKLRVKAYEYVLNLFNKEGWVPDLIHARTAEYAGVHAAIISKKYKIPLLLTENCIFVLDKTITKRRLENYRFAVESANTIAVVSHYLKAFLLTNNFKCNPVVLGNMIDETKFSLKPANVGSSGFFTILTIGHTGFTKDWPTFFKVIDILINKQKITDIRVNIAITHIYDDYSKNYVPNLVKEYGLEKYCKIYYEVPRNNIENIYHESDIFVSTSVNETFGIATCEAMYCGLPVIATRNGGIEDFISNANGRLTDIGDYELIAAYILAIKNKKMVFEPEKIRASVIHKFNKQAFTNKLKELYENLIKLNMSPVI